jgi:hypothetical protein
MIIQVPDPKMRHLDMADEDWDTLWKISLIPCVSCHRST